VFVADRDGERLRPLAFSALSLAGASCSTFGSSTFASACSFASAACAFAAPPFGLLEVAAPLASHANDDPGTSASGYAQLARRRPPVSVVLAGGRGEAGVSGVAVARVGEEAARRPV